MRLNRFFIDPKTILIIAAAVVCLVAAAPAAVMAQDEAPQADNGDVPEGDLENDEDVDEEAPAFSNPAQAQKAANIAQASVAAADASLQAIEDAQQALDAAVESGDEAAIDKAQKALDKAIENELQAVTEEDVHRMRYDDGMGWGQIARAVGVHPGVLGLGNKYGHTQTHRNQSMAAHGYGKQAGAMNSTTRDLKTGGNAYGLSKAGKGKGKGLGASNAGGVGSASGKGNKGDKGNSGNSGNGKGGGKGKDK